MFIWVGCDVNSKFIEYRNEVREFNKQFNLNENALVFPQHISLKITFELEDGLARHCIKDFTQFLQGFHPFTVKLVGAELHEGGIIWLKVAENKILRDMHDEIVEIAKSYAVPPHPLDKEYMFHSTVIMDGEADETKLLAMLEKVKTIKYPEELVINTLLVGHSDDGIDFKVDRRIKIK